MNKSTHFIGQPMYGQLVKFAGQAENPLNQPREWGRELRQALRRMAASGHHPLCRYQFTISLIFSAMIIVFWQSREFHGPKCLLAHESLTHNNHVLLPLNLWQIYKTIRNKLEQNTLC
jgi:hypothetical protein